MKMYRLLYKQYRYIAYSYVYFLMNAWRKPVTLKVKGERCFSKLRRTVILKRSMQSTESEIPAYGCR